MTIRYNTFDDYLLLSLSVRSCVMGSRVTSIYIFIVASSLSLSLSRARSLSLSSQFNFFPRVQHQPFVLCVFSEGNERCRARCSMGGAIHHQLLPPFVMCRYAGTFFTYIFHFLQKLTYRENMTAPPPLPFLFLTADPSQVMADHRAAILRVQGTVEFKVDGWLPSHLDGSLVRSRAAFRVFDVS